MNHIYTVFDLLTVTDFREGKKGGDIYPIWFPLVGFVIGLILCLVFAIFYLFFPLDIAIVFSIFAYAIFTAGKHIDDFADYIDALLGGRTVERRQEILRDSNAGTFAIVAIIFLLVLYFKMFSQFESTYVFMSLFLMPAIARWSILYPVLEEIKEGEQMKKYTKHDFYIITAVVAIIGFLLLGWHALVLMLIASILASVIFHKSSKIFGNGHDDVRGFIIESNGIIFLLGLYILIVLF